jgi:acyl-CoA dehydrogenase
MAMDAATFSALIETLRRFVEERLIPAERSVAESDRVPPELVADMKRLGLFGLTVPTEYGGLGLTLSEEIEAAFVLGRAAPAMRSIIGTNNGIGSQGLVLDGTEEQRRRYLPRIASGELIASFALTEPEAGSDAASLKTSARKAGGDWIINGTKRYITNSPHAGLFTVLARTDPGEKGARGISAFLVEREAPGLSIGKPNKKMGQQGAHTADVILDNCRVPASALVGGQEGQGFRTAMKVLDRGRLHIAAVCVGLAERLIEDALTYALERRQFGQPIAEFQLIQAMLADSKTEAYAARAMVKEAARKREEGGSIATEAACCKLFSTEMVGRVADRAVQIHGGAGYMADYAVERLYRDARLFRIYEGTSQIQQLVIARNMIRERRG